MFIFDLEDLEDLEDITDKLVFEEELLLDEDQPSIFTEEYAVELVETALHLMDEYMEQNPNAISDPNFHDILLEEIQYIFYIQMENHIDDIDIGEDIEDDMNEILEDAFNIFITTFHTERSNDNNTFIVKVDEDEIDEIEFKINKLREIPQPVQRTPEWYKFRWNLITASNAYKAFESQSAINQLIYEKCQPLKDFNIDETEEIKMVNTNTPMHWGQKYEPLSVMIYEDMYSSRVEDFGCIQHSTYKFLGASPDGIIIESNTGRYGRMLEIKNPVSREITGIPKKEYWVQMQLQMEVCDLDDCDFLETKFSEYTDSESFKNDSFISLDHNGMEVKSLVKTKDDKYKGTIIYFHTKDGKPFYLYRPLNLSLHTDIEEWEEENIEKYQSDPYNYIFLKYIYWRIDKLSCVLISRNKDWFKNNIGKLENVWKIIEEERVTGYEHRAPNKKQKKECFKPFVNTEHSGCFLKIVKLDNNNDNNNNNNNNNEN
jgi:putative phage-type endonuclease